MRDRRVSDQEGNERVLQKENKDFLLKVNELFLITYSGNGEEQSHIQRKDSLFSLKGKERRNAELQFPNPDTRWQ